MFSHIFKYLKKFLVDDQPSMLRTHTSIQQPIIDDYDGFSLVIHDQNTRNRMWLNLRAALRGDKDAQYTMGLSYLNGQLGLDRSYLHAEKWLDQAAHQGHPGAMQELQDAYNKLAF